MNVEEIIQRNKDLSSQNDSWKSYFQDLADYCLPRKAWITSIRTKGERLKFNFLYDSTAIRALKTMAAGFHSNLTNPSSKWFGLQPRNIKLRKDRSIVMWFKEVEDTMFSILNNSNFDTTMQEFYMDAGCFGTGTILTLEDPQTKVRFTSVPIEQLNLEEDATGRVISVYRNFKLTAAQAYRKWGKDAGKAVVDTAKDKPGDQMDFLHYVGPRSRRDVGKADSKNLPFQSMWISMKENHVMEESGFHELPYAVGRFWKDTNDVFGFSPAMDVFPDIKLINAQQRTTIRAAMKQADPPMQAPSKGYMLPLNLNPAAMNYRNPDVDPNALQALPVSSGNLQVTLEVMAAVQKNIEEGFFVPLFRALSEVNKQMTIPEVQRRIMENMVLLGPVVGRWTQEVLDTIIIRVFNMGYRNGEFPVAPRALQNEDFDVIYLSPLAKAQRESDMIAIEGFLNTARQIAQFSPTVLDKIDSDKTIDVIAQIKGVTPEIIRDNKDVEEMRKQRAAMQKEQMQMDQAHKAAAIAETAGNAEHKFAKAKNEG